MSSIMGNAIPVLDYGFVRLVDHMGSDLSIVRSARVSYNSDWRAGTSTGSDTRLINYLWSHRHTTPFESVTFTFEVKAPIFVIRQWHRHRTWSYNEVSARYTELPHEFYVPDPELVGTQSQSNKQGRDISRDRDVLSRRQFQVVKMHETIMDAFALYEELLGDGWPRELARSVLPVATYTRMFATVNLLNLLKFLTLRSDDHAQHEIRVYADAIIQLIGPIVPVTMAAWRSTN